ncbi:ABSCISIC ACID-INSENSITIVE 5-like protein 2 isoform X2 [Macadamia integrifolia]|uniref:ABSCISIC ACID-INSENSITIVE 5-like protein 2 isoform X2 n=1 Tax=Macadamia integrifolia TaxID=60698 RepID=UPI001C4E54EB|nr:ABSCISIC ACID-INSENSITIVE 5-like protein 2 isoform X2 [Macadamia integrifolia]
MVVPESKAVAHGKLELGTPAAEEITSSKSHSLSSSLGRQTSIYSLTLDEFQNSLENGKKFGSMNMDEFLNNIWNADQENQANQSDDDTSPSIQNQRGQSGEKSIASQRSLPRQVSLTLSGPLSRKTVEEVWEEIRRTQEEEPSDGGGSHTTTATTTTTTTHRQATFGEMTLEDFLVKAGVVRESGPPQVAAPPAHETQQYDLYNNTNAAALEPINFGIGPVLGLGYTNHHRSSGDAMGVINVPSSYQAFPTSDGVVGETSNYVGNGKRNGGGYPATAGAVCFGGRATISPASPGSSDGTQAENSGAMGSCYRVAEMGGLRGRKRVIDGPVEVVVERRQRRMIKNRESAARSRARKQAYTVELEAELNQLKEENAHLKRVLAESEKRRRQEDEMKEKPPTKARKAEEKLKMMRRSISFPIGLCCDDHTGI